ncbi:hypothetical protein Mal15_38240 [Stieleria maiorica]|uniref:Uncharacterized protein n=1 Tax=Stieleria maiorica TaxID=2795974 RepID=A0A5B9MF70_9BACT|nr:hypothetical protein [Stieleria maiorica]QEF99758.1 hypothetical protein Mal15_38240 [Stieleria maiorica]
MNESEEAAFWRDVEETNEWMREHNRKLREMEAEAIDFKRRLIKLWRETGISVDKLRHMERWELAEWEAASAAEAKAGATDGIAEESSDGPESPPVGKTFQDLTWARCFGVETRTIGRWRKDKSFPSSPCTVESVKQWAVKNKKTMAEDPEEDN